MSNLRCDFKSPSFVAEINKFLSDVINAPELLDFQKRQLVARVEIVRFWTDLVSLISVDEPTHAKEIDIVVDERARTDDLLIEYQTKLRELEKSLAVAKSQFNVFTGNAQGLREKWQGFLQNRGFNKQSDSAKLDLQNKITDQTQELNLLQETARLRLMEVTDHVRGLLREDLAAKKQELDDRVHVLSQYVSAFSAAVDALAQAVTTETTNLQAHAQYLQQEVARLCKQFNDEQDRPRPVLPPVAPVIETIMQTSQNFVVELQKLLVGLKVETAFDLNPQESRCAKAGKDCQKALGGKPTSYQLALAELGSFAFPDVRMLELLDPGTGKSCLLSLLEQRLILSVARVLDAGGALPSNFPETPVPILVLLYSPSEFRKYETAQAEDFCKYDDWTQLITVDKPVENSKGTAITTAFRLKSTKQVIAVSRAQKFTQKPDITGYADLEKNHRLDELFRGPQGIPRPGGVVLVDEAHYLFDPGDIVPGASNTMPMLDALLLENAIKIFFLTGTASANSAKFENTLRMAAFLNAVAGSNTGDQFAFGLSRKDIVKKFDLHDPRRQKLFDELFEEDPEAQNDREEEAVFDPSEVKESQGVRWRPGKKEEFMEVISKHVSYITLKYDRGVYPHLRVTPKLQSIARGAPVVPEHMSAVIRYEPGSDSFQFVETKTAPGIAPYLQVNVPYDNAAKLEGKIRGPKANKNKYGTYFKYNADNKSPQTHRAISAFIRAQPGNKFFIWTPAKRWDYSGMPDFIKTTLEGPDLKMKQVELTAELKALWNVDPATYDPKDLERGECLRLKTYVDRAYATILSTKRERYLNLSAQELKHDKELYQKLLALDNAPQNADGSYIRVKNGDYSTREALSMFDNHYELLVEPPQSASSKKQVEARINRFCGMKSTSKVADWWTTVVIFVAVPGPSSKITETWQQTNMRLVDHDMSSPSGLLDQAMHEAAVTCKMFDNLNQVGQCYGEPEEEKIEGMHGAGAVGLMGSRQFARPCWFADPVKGVQTVDARLCTGFVNFEDYSVWDEIVFQMLTEAELAQTDTPSQDPTVAFKLLKAVWATSAPLQPYVDYSSGRPKPELFIQWLRRAAQLEPDEPRDRVMLWFASLLYARREQVEPLILEALRSQAQIYVEAHDKSQAKEMKRAAELSRLNLNEKDSEARALLSLAQKVNNNDIINESRRLLHEYAPELERSQIGNLQ